MQANKGFEEVILNTLQARFKILTFKFLRAKNYKKMAKFLKKKYKQDLEKRKDRKMNRRIQFFSKWKINDFVCSLSLELKVCRKGTNVNQT